MASKKKRTEIEEIKRSEERAEAIARNADDAPQTPPPEIVDDIAAPAEAPAPAKEEVMTEEETRADAPGTSDADIVRELTAILKVPKARDSVMVFSMYSTRDFNRRYFLLDVDGNAYRRAWVRYKELSGGDDPVHFLELVYRILNTDLPRLHRNVDWVPLT